MIIAATNLHKAKGVSSPVEEGKPWAEDEEAKRLNSDMASELRTLAATANYLALDRPDIQLAAEEICRGMDNRNANKYIKVCIPRGAVRFERI